MDDIEINDLAEGMRIRAYRQGVIDDIYDSTILIHWEDNTYTSCQLPYFLKHYKIVNESEGDHGSE